VGSDDPDSNACQVAAHSLCRPLWCAALAAEVVSCWLLQLM
jgi:hypothetical protein